MLAAFTSAFARLKLYSVLEKLQDRVLYYDTDSVIFVTRGDEWKPKLGDNLGELTSELEDADQHIVKFMSGGPKNYSFITNQPGRKSGKDTFTKVKGINLNFANTKLVNSTVMEQFIKSPPGNDNFVSVPEPYKIVLNKKDGLVLSLHRKKDYRIVYTKRVIKENFDTVPYGWNHISS